jgi:hypothetical protein
MGVYVSYTTTTTTGAVDSDSDFRIQNRPRDPLSCALVHIPTRCGGSAARSGQGEPGRAAPGPRWRPPHAPAEPDGFGFGFGTGTGAFCYAMGVWG